MRLREIPPDASTLRSALPRFLPGGDAGVLLLHGFTGTPRDIARMADHLQSTGFAVSVPRLPGHGTNGTDFLQTDCHDWLRAAADAWLDLRARCEIIHIVGHSMGAVLAVLLASHFPAARLVLLAPAFKFTNRLLPWSFLIGLFVRRIRWQVTAQEEISDSDYSALSREYWQWRYPRQGASYLRLRRMAVRALRRVTSDTLIIVGEADRNVPTTVVPFLEKRMTSATTRHAVYEHATHLLFTGPYAQNIRKQVSDWLTAPAATVTFRP
ncbi:MAG: alpha/beta fold hydrolase [Spirochaetia bacterium]|jgi:carboxylesterase